VKLSNLPAECELKDIFSIIWGGRVQSLRYTKGENTCEVLFLTADACKAYCHDAAAGIAWPDDPNRLITIDSVSEDEPTDFETGLVATPVSRCLRVTNIHPNIGTAVLKAVAMEKGKRVERIQTGKYGAVSNFLLSLISTASGY
jgi:hypothetical protein